MGFEFGDIHDPTHCFFCCNELPSQDTQCCFCGADQTISDLEKYENINFLKELD